MRARHIRRLQHALFIGAVSLAFACNADAPIIPKPSAGVNLGRPSDTWIAPEPCKVFKNNPYAYFGTVAWYVPTGGTDCGVYWHVSYPGASYYPPETDWRPDNPATVDYTRWSIGNWTDIQYGPIEIAFESRVKNVDLVLTKEEAPYNGVLSPGHYMVALDSAGQEIGRADFDGGVMVSEKMLAVGGIRKVLIYPVVWFYTDAGEPVSEQVSHRVAYDTDPDSPPPGKLTCTSVVRGLDVSCTVTGTGVAVTGWKFEGDGYAGLVESPITEASSVNPWKGKAVTSGTVTAAIAYNGVPQPLPLTAQLVVKGRGWHWTKSGQWSYSKTAPKCGAGLMIAFEPTDYGWSTRKGVCDPYPLLPDPIQGTTDGFKLSTPVTAGPNKGMTYITQVTYTMPTQSNINATVLSNSSVVFQILWDLDKGACSLGAKLNFYTYNAKCRAYNVTPFIDAIWNHEGYGKVGNGHQAQLETAAADSTNDPWNILERVFSSDLSVTQLLARQEAQKAATRLSVAWLDETRLVTNLCNFPAWLYDRTTSQRLFQTVVDPIVGGCL